MNRSHAFDWWPYLLHSRLTALLESFMWMKLHKISTKNTFQVPLCTHCCSCIIINIIRYIHRWNALALINIINTRTHVRDKLNFHRNTFHVHFHVEIIVSHRSLSAMWISTEWQNMPCKEHGNKKINARTHRERKKKKKMYTPLRCMGKYVWPNMTRTTQSDIGCHAQWTYTVEIHIDPQAGVFNPFAIIFHSIEFWSTWENHT